MRRPENKIKGLGITNNYAVAQSIIALEELHVLEYIEKHKIFSIKEISNKFQLRENLLSATFEYLTIQGIFCKKNNDTFQSIYDMSKLRFFANFLLAYKDVYNSFSQLLNYSISYGDEVERNNTFLRKTDAYAVEAKKVIIKRLKKLNAHHVLEIGCGGGNFLLELADELKNFQGIGIDIDKEVIKTTKEFIYASKHRDKISIEHGDARYPEYYSKKIRNVDAIIGMAIFHEFKKNNNLFSILNKYKTEFPKAKLFIVELDIPEWDEIAKMPIPFERNRVSFYKFTHYLSEQGLPQSKDKWVDNLTNSGWSVVSIHEVSNRVLVIECK